MRLRRTVIVLAELVVVTGCSVSEPDSGSEEIPADFDENRVLVRPVTQSGDTLVFYTDTGGGMNMLYAPAADRLGIERSQVVLGTDTMFTAAWPVWSSGLGIPAPRDTTSPFSGRLIIMPFGSEAARVHDSTDAGFLGRLWFADRVWTFDYPARRLLLHTAPSPRHSESAQPVVLGFQLDSAGGRTTHFPRIRIEIAGDSLDLLFDTGATTDLTDSALTIIGDNRPGRRASSFISGAVFDRWRTENPQWRVIQQGTEAGADLIEVPEVAIAGQHVGPVWFERRNVGTFEDHMSRWMDQPIVGALGGNALGFFRVTIDYPNAVAFFERPGS
jgi:hypothetical protein